MCAGIGFTSSTFHLAWFSVMVGTAAWASGLRPRVVLLDASLPAAVLAAVCVKNFVLCGEFAASTAVTDLVGKAIDGQEIGDLWAEVAWSRARHSFETMVRILRILVAFVAAGLLAVMALVPAVAGVSMWKIVLAAIGLVVFISAGLWKSRD